jgi:hypothetical protein
VAHFILSFSIEKKLGELALRFGLRENIKSKIKNRGLFPVLDMVPEKTGARKRVFVTLPRRLFWGLPKNRSGYGTNQAVKKTSRPVAALFLLAALTACSGAPAPGTSARPEAGGEPAAVSDPVSRALDTALERRSWEELRLESECRDDAGHLRSVTLFGSGVGIWNRERQFPLSRERLLGLLEAVRAAGFGSMRETHGGKSDPEPVSSAAWGLQLICRVRLALDGVEKQSYQLSEGRQDAGLKNLAERILAVGEELGPSGVAADSLEDGLARIARGELAPEALTLQLQREPEDPKSAEKGWILRIEHGRAQISFHTPETGWTDPKRVPLARDEVAGLARQLAAANPEDLPVNLYSSWYEDLEIRVLNRKKSLQARRFAGLTPETHGEKQKRLEQVLAVLEDFEKRVAGAP